MQVGGKHQATLKAEEGKYEMKLATFNIFWLGNSVFTQKASEWTNHNEDRKEEDWSRIAHVISKIDADVIAFQEIVSLEELQKVLDLANNQTSRSYRIYDKNNKLLGTGSAAHQKIVIAYDAKKYELMAASPIFGDEGRPPFGVRLRSLEDAEEVLVVGVHFKSGQPQFDDEDSADRRKLQCQHLADWIAGAHDSSNPVLPKPSPTDHVVILGDFNALYELEPNHPAHWEDIIVKSLNPLRENDFAAWSWEKPLADPAGGDRTTSYLERYLIDFIMLSPSLKNRIVQPPGIYAYDRDSAITNNFTANVDYRVSDHRPVYAEINISPT